MQNPTDELVQALARVVEDRKRLRALLRDYRTFASEQHLWSIPSMQRDELAQRAEELLGESRENN